MCKLIKFADSIAARIIFALYDLADFGQRVGWKLADWVESHRQGKSKG